MLSESPRWYGLRSSFALLGVASLVSWLVVYVLLELGLNTAFFAISQEGIGCRVGVVLSVLASACLIVVVVECAVTWLRGVVVVVNEAVGGVAEVGDVGEVGDGIDIVGGGVVEGVECVRVAGEVVDDVSGGVVAGLEVVAVEVGGC